MQPDLGRQDPNEDTIDVLQNNQQPNSPENRHPNFDFPPYPENDFILLEFLGKGRNGTVFKAFNKKVDRLVAIKKIPLEDPINNLGHRFALYSETQIIKKLSQENSPHFLEYYGIYQDESALYIEMQPGMVSLFEVLQTGRRFSIKEILFLLKSLVDALISFEEKGIVNRDVKPGNILLIPTSEPHIFDFKIYDFGIGYVLNENEVRRRRIHKDTILGFTPEYTAPEVSQIIAEFDQSSELYDPFSADLYSLGQTALKLLGGRELMAKSLKAFIEYYGEMGAIIASMLVPEPERRINPRFLTQRLEKMIQNMRVMTPKIEKSAIFKALRDRFKKQCKNDPKMLIFNFLEFLRKYFEIGKPEELEFYLEIAFSEIFREHSLQFTYEEVKILEVAGLHFQRLGKTQLAEKLLSEAYNIAKSLLWGPQRGVIAETSVFWGLFWAEQGDCDKSEKLLKEGYELNLAEYGENHLYTINGMRYLGDLYLQKGEYLTALDLLTKVFNKLCSLLFSQDKPSNSHLLYSLMNLLTMKEISYLRWLRVKEENQVENDQLIFLANGTEEQVLKKAIKIKEKAWKKILDRINRDLALVMGSLGRLHLILGDIRKAKIMLVRGLRIISSICGQFSWEVSRFYSYLSQVFSSLDCFQKAEKMILRALEIQLRGAKKNHETRANLKELERIYGKMGDEKKLVNLQEKWGNLMNIEEKKA